MDRRRVALLFVVAFLMALPARAQGPQSSLAARIAAVEARLAALETFDESDVVGNWKWVSLGIELDRGYAPDTPARVKTSTDTIVLTLNADHTVSVFGTPTGRSCTLPILQFGIASCRTHEEEEPPPPGTTLTWSLANRVVTILGSPDDGPLIFELSANGTVAYSDGSEFLPGHTWTTVGILLKQ